MVLYEMVAGRPPFEGETHSDTIVSILEREPERVDAHALKFRRSWNGS